MASFKSFKKLSTAKAFAKGGPVLRVGDLYVSSDDAVPSYTSVDLIATDGHISGTVTIRHLERLGNANWAIAQKHFDPAILN